MPAWYARVFHVIVAGVVELVVVIELPPKKGEAYHVLPSLGMVSKMSSVLSIGVAD